MSPFSIYAMALQRHKTHFFSKMFRDEVKDKHIYDMVADDYGILWIIVSEQLKSTWNTGMVN